MKSEVSLKIEQASMLLDKTRLPQIVYSRNGRLAVMSLKQYLDLNLDDKGGKRITVVTKNAYGKTIF